MQSSDCKDEICAATPSSGAANAYVAQLFLTWGNDLRTERKERAVEAPLPVSYRVYLVRPPCFAGSSVHSGSDGKEDLNGFGSGATAADDGAVHRPVFRRFLKQIEQTRGFKKFDHANYD